MAIAPLQLPPPIQNAPINWSGLDKIGDAVAGYRNDQKQGDAIGGYLSTLGQPQAQFVPQDPQAQTPSGGEPRGIRNNNPGNIEDGPFARSQPGYVGSDGRFAKYASLDHGANAATNLLAGYGSKGLNTVQGIIGRWAPSSDGNNVGAYAGTVASQLGVKPDQPLEMNDPSVRSVLAQAMFKVENGKPVQPQNPATAQVPQQLPPDQIARLQEMIRAGGPARQLALGVMQKYVTPQFGFQTTGDGTIVRTNPNTGTVEPVYNAEVKPVAVAPGTELIDPNTGKRIYGNDTSQLPPETIDQMARQAIAGDTSVFTNLGRGAQSSQNIVAVRKRMAEINAGTGESGAEQANRNAEFFGEKAGQRTRGSRQANIELAATEFEQILPVVQKASQSVKRTDYPTLNRLFQAIATGTGDPNIVAFGGAVNTLINVYARAISPSGVATVSDKDHAREILDKAWSQGQFDAAVGMMKQEIGAALNSPSKVRDDMRKRFIEGQPGAAPAATPAAPVAPASETKLPTYATPQDVLRAMKERKIKSGDQFMTPDGQIRTAK